MKARPECIPCILEQVLRVARSVTQDDWLEKKVLVESMKTLSEADLSRPPAEIVFDVVREAGKILGKHDVFEENKSLFTKESLAFEPKAKELIEKSADRLKTAAKIAAGAGVISVLSKPPVDIEAAIIRASGAEFAVDDFEQFQKDLAKAKKIVYILGNAGEVVFDRLFAAELKGKNIIFVARKSPILLDATVSDARAAKLDKAGKVIDPGRDLLGTPIELVSSEFREALEAADLIIVKGQNNYETLAGAELPPMYFVLTAKCACVAKGLGVNVGDLVCARNTGE